MTEQDSWVCCEVLTIGNFERQLNTPAEFTPVGAHMAPQAPLKARTQGPGPSGGCAQGAGPGLVALGGGSVASVSRRLPGSSEVGGRSRIGVFMACLSNARTRRRRTPLRKVRIDIWDVCVSPEGTSKGGLRRARHPS